MPSEKQPIRFDSWCDAWDACHAAGKPLSVVVAEGGVREYATIYPTGYLDMTRIQTVDFIPGSDPRITADELMHGASS